MKEKETLTKRTWKILFAPASDHSEIEKMKNRSKKWPKDNFLLKITLYLTKITIIDHRNEK